VTLAPYWFLTDMNCPYCGHCDLGVLESRETEEGRVVRRRRECGKCKKRFTTYERVGNMGLKVVKKDGRKEDFCREKVERGVKKSCWKRPVSEEAIVELVDEVEMMLLNRKNTEIPSRDIGKLILNRMKKLDPIAYVRFATVYLDFNSIDEFKNYLAKAFKDGNKNNHQKN
jgi:transcriptional repressor NrdR